MADGFEGLTRAMRRIHQLATDTKHVEQPLKEAGEYMVGSIKRKQFLAGGTPKWSLLAPSTLRRRRKGKGRGGARVLIDKAILMGSVNKKVVASPPSVRVGVPDDSGPKGGKRAKRLHFGYPGGAGRGHAHTPARPYVVMLPEDVNAIGRLFGRHVARK
jgi:phage gpG-like protein